MYDVGEVDVDDVDDVCFVGEADLDDVDDVCDVDDADDGNQ